MEDHRKATESDLDRIVELAEGLRRELGPMRGGDLWIRRESASTPLDDTVALWLNDPRYTLLVGTYEGSIVGYGIMEKETLADQSHLGIIHEIYVEDASRSVSVGESLLDGLAEAANEQKCVGLDVRVLPGHRLAKNFFEAQDFRARIIVMHRDLKSNKT